MVDCTVGGSGGAPTLFEGGPLPPIHPEQAEPRWVPERVSIAGLCGLDGVFRSTCTVAPLQPHNAHFWGGERLCFSCVRALMVV